MAQRRFISRFTPSRTKPKDLEAILVQRQPLLQDALERVLESIHSSSKHQLLFVGPRGSGKTHLVSLLFFRLDAMTNIRDRVCIAWLNEDESTTNVLDLLLRIVRALEKKYPSDFPHERRDALHDLAPGDATQHLLDLLFRALRGRTLVVLVENLDELFLALGRSGQHDLRAIVQNHPVFCLVATSSRLFEGVRRRESPFFGFFQTEHLTPLSVPEAVALFRKIAQLSGQNDLAQFLTTPAGHARIRVLHHLAGGNQRLHIVLSEFMTRDSIEELVEPFEQMLDELTPYYQDRIRSLPPQQRKIIEALASADGPQPVKEIARLIFASQQTVASQLKHLREAGFVENQAQGRESYYELSEPLMRMSLRVKENQPREPFHLLIDFLRCWYDREELLAQLEALPTDANERRYVELALDSLNTTPSSPRVIWLLEDLERLGKEPSDERIDVLRALVAERGSTTDRALLVNSLLNAERFEEALAEANLALARAEGLGADEAFPLLMAGAISLAAADDYASAVQDLTRAIEMPGTSKIHLALGSYCRGILLQLLDRGLDAVLAYGVAIDQGPLPTELFADAHWRRALLRSRQEKTIEAIADFSAFIELVETTNDVLTSTTRAKLPEAYLHRGLEKAGEGAVQDGIEDLTKSLDLELAGPFRELAFYARGIARHAMSELQLALHDFEQVTDVSKSNLARAALMKRAEIYETLGRAQDSVAAWSAAIEMAGASDPDIAMARFRRARGYVALGQMENARLDLNAVIDLGDSSGTYRATAFAVRGVLHLGSPEHTIADLDAALGLLGPSEPMRANVLLHRARAHVQLGRSHLAMLDYAAALEIPGAEPELSSEALHALATDDFRNARWEHGFSRLDRALGLQRAPEATINDHTVGIVRTVLHSGLGREAWQPRAESLVALYSKHGALAALGAALVRGLTDLRDSGLDASGYENWLQVWRHAGRDYPALLVGLRLLSAGIGWLTSKSARALLRVPKEERKILRQALGLDEQ